MDDEPLEYVLLDLLVDGSSSVAAIYGTLVHHCGYSRGMDVALLIGVFSRMERRGWVTAAQMADDGSFHEPSEVERRRDLEAYHAWLPLAEFEELSVDEVGLWYEITMKGRAEWKRWPNGSEEQSNRRWMIDDLKEMKTVCIQAETVEIAETALRRWFSYNPSVNLVDDSRRIESVAAFTLRDGTVITNGVRLIYDYRL